MMTWARIDWNDTPRIECFWFDFDPFTEQMISIRRVDMKLWDYILMDPRLDRWLIQMARIRNLPVRDEQIEPHNSD